MIKLERIDPVNGSPITVPSSLNSRNTITRRNELIAHGAWKNDTRYRRPYKNDDVRAALMLFSFNKCCFCEQILTIATATTVPDDSFSREHFRSKSKYWWLAYSWDNLLSVCTACNGAKEDAFDINGTFRPYLPTDLANIHTLAEIYNRTEQPNYIHPEFDNPETLIEYRANGTIFSSDSKGTNTILAYNLDRIELQRLRKKIYGDFKTEYDLIMLSGKTDEDKKSDILTMFRNFSVESDEEHRHNPFLGFRRYVMRNDIRNLILS